MPLEKKKARLLEILWKLVAIGSSIAGLNIYYLDNIIYHFILSCLSFTILYSMVFVACIFVLQAGPVTFQTQFQPHLVWTLDQVELLTWYNSYNIMVLYISFVWLLIWCLVMIEILKWMHLHNQIYTYCCDLARTMGRIIMIWSTHLNIYSHPQTWHQNLLPYEK